jgi:ketosteroid isomerase-like protein
VAAPTGHLRLGCSLRRDYELMVVRFAPDIEVEFAPEFEALGLGGTFRGHDGMLKLIETFGEAWERWNLLPEIVLDLGDRVLLLGTLRLAATTSGLQLEPDYAELMTARGGLVAHDEFFFGWDEGLRAAGLHPDAIALPSRGEAGKAAGSAG